MTTTTAAAAAAVAAAAQQLTASTRRNSQHSLAVGVLAVESRQSYLLLLLSVVSQVDIIIDILPVAATLTRTWHALRAHTNPAR